MQKDPCPSADKERRDARNRSVPCLLRVHGGNPDHLGHSPSTPNES
jgi:hypothetical protein